MVVRTDASTPSLLASVSALKGNDMIDLKNIDTDSLEEMHQAAELVAETMRVLQKSETNVVGEILKTSEKFLEWEHIPNEDVYDRQSHCQYYYHAHKKSKDGTDLHDDEHGHFHTFIRGRGMPDGMTPVALPDYDSDMDIGEVNSHVIGIGMNEMGIPIRLFTVNRWVTGETWHKADDVISLLDQFEIDNINPSWPVNLWVTNMVALFKPQITELILKRDLQIEEWHKQYPDDDNIFENRELEITSYLDINLADYVTAIDDELESRG